MSSELSPIASSVVSGERRAIAKAITLVESTRPEDAAQADALLGELYPRTGHAVRVGISGTPGAGKSTLIDALGRRVIASQRKLGVIAIDPSSQLTGGSVLGDRTRMTRLSRAAEAFVRASPSSGAGGGIGRRTRETMVVLEAGGYQVLVVETVGTGQAETAVTQAVDLLVLVLLAGGGDDVQGLKRGLLEHADLVVFNKADGDDLERCQAASDQLSSLFSWLRKDPPPVLTVSALEERGIDELWQQLEQRFADLLAAGVIEQRRRAQRRAWLDAALQEAMLGRLASVASLDSRSSIEAVERGELLPRLAAARILQALEQSRANMPGPQGR